MTDRARNASPANFGMAKRNFGLDLMRALAISMVFFAHGVSSLEPLGVGVDLFFLLSGFLIGRIYFRGQDSAHQARKPFSVWRFWQARWLRTLPPYLATLALCALAQPLLHNNGVHPAYLLFLQNYTGIDGFGVSWSLAVEEHFYLALPLLGGLALYTVGRRALVWLLPALALVPQLLRLTAIVTTGLPERWYWMTHLHSEGLILGVWLACVFVDRPQLWRALRRPAWGFAALPLCLLVYQFMTPSQPLAFRAVVFLLYAIGYAAWVRLSYDVRFAPASRAGTLFGVTVQGVALTSYSIYLIHSLAFSDVRLFMGGLPRGPLKSGIILLVSLGISIAFYFLVERPALTLRDRLLKAEPRPALTGAEQPATA